MKRHLLYDNSLLSHLPSAPSQKKGKVSLWAATLAKKEEVIRHFQESCNKTLSDDVPDAVSRDRYAKANS